MNTEHVTLAQLVAFSIFMEHNQGILGKAPSYIKEKFALCTQTTNPEHLASSMDGGNRAKFDEWRQRWTPQK